MFAYCRNNPTSRVDSKGTEDDDINAEMDRLLNEYATIDETGFTIDLESATAEWNSCISEMGVKEAYEYMSDYLCQKYKEKYEKEFLFSNSCVAYEIEYHVDAYMSVKGNSGYSRNITTYFMSAKYLIDHCKVVNISTNDVGNFKQEKMFGYKNGIRECYKNTPDDPYREDREPLWKRILWW